MAGRPRKTKAYIYRNSGRPTKMTKECVKKLEEAFAIGANVTMACFYADISRVTYYDWLQKNPEFSNRIDELKEKLPLKALTNIAESIHGKNPSGNLEISKWLLERKRNDEYGEKTKIEHSGEIQNLSEENKEAIAQFHANLKNNIKKKSIEIAKKEGEIK